MKKVITVDGKPKHVFVLRETEQHYVYISLHHIDKVDYIRMLNLTKETDTDLLEAMRTHRFDNGMIGLNLYQDVIKTCRKVPDGEDKPTVALVEDESKESKQEEKSTETKSESTALKEEVKRPPRRRPGRPKKTTS